MNSSSNEYMLSLVALLEKQKSRVQINKDIKELEKVVSKLKLIGTLTKGQTKTQINQTIQQLEAQLRQVKLQAKVDSRQLNREINNALRNVSARDIRLNINGSGERLNAQLRRILSQAREFADRNPIRVNIDLKKEKLLNQLTTFVNKNTKINESAYWLGEAERLRTVISSVTNREELRNATDQLQVFTTGVRATGYATVSTTDKIKGMLGNVFKVCNYFGLAFTAVNKFRQSLVSLKEMDTLLTEISKTSEMTAKQLEELGNRSYGIASKYGVLANNFMESFREMSRAGFGEDKAQSLAELATLTQSAGDLTSELANEYLIASNAAYGYSGNVERLNALLDAQNQVTNRNAVSMTKLADATKVAANQLANAAISEQEMTALLGTGIATTKESGQVVGRAVKAIVMNLQQVQNTDEGLETTAEDLGKVESCLDSLGISMKETADGITRLRSPLAILSELAEVYNSLPEDSVERANIISDIGGKYRGNVLSSILSNWDTYIKMMGDYEDAAGSALREAEKSADSWEGRLAQLQNSWDSFVASLTDKEMIKGGISFLDGTIQAFEKLVDTIGALPVMLTTINAGMTALNKNYGITQIFNADTHKIDLRGNFMGIDISAYKTQIKHFQEAEIAMASWNNSLVDGTADINAFNNATVQNNEQLKAYLQTTSTDAPASLSGYKAYLNAAGVSTDALRLKTVLLNAAISMGIGIAVQFAMKGVMLLAQKIDKLANASQHAAESAKELASEMNNSISSLSSNASTLSDLNDEYQKLSKGVNKLGENVSLSTEDYSRYKDIISQVSAIMPDLTTYFNAQGEKIAFAKGELVDLNEEYEKYIKSNALDFVTKGDDEGNTIQNILDTYNNNESYDGFEKFWKMFKSEIGLVDIENFSSKEIISELEKLESMDSIQEIADYLSSYDKELGAKPDFSNPESALKYVLLEKLGLNAKDKEEILAMTEEDYNSVMQNVIGYIHDYKLDISSDMQDIQTAIIQSMYSKDAFWDLGKEQRNNVSTFLSSIDSDIWDELNIKTDHELNLFVNKVIDAISNNKDGFADAWNGLFNPELEDLPVNEYAQQIDTFLKTICKVLGLDETDGVHILKFSFGFDNTVDTAKRLQNSLRQIADDHGIADREESATLYEYTKDFTQAQAELWLEVTLGAQNATEAVQMYEDAMADVVDTPTPTLSISDTISQLNTQLKPALDSLKSAYNDIFTDDGEFALNSIDILSTCDSIKSKLDELNEMEGITVDYSSYEDFVRVLRDSESESDDVRLAFDSLATSITQAALSGTEDFETMKAALEDLGVVNNEIVAFDALASNAEMLDEALTQANVSMDDFIVSTEDGSVAATEAGLEFLKEKVGAENCAEALSILAFHKQLCNEQGINTAAEVANLRILAENAGYTGEVIQHLTELEQIYQEVASGTINPIVIGAKIGRAAMLQAMIQGAATKINYEAVYKPMEKAASKAGSSAGKAAGESFEDALKDKLSDLDDVINYISDTIGDQIDLFEDQKDAAVEALEAEKEVAEEALEAEKALVQEKIDAKQAEIDAIEEAAKARKNELDLQKAQYDLERMQNQKTMLVNYMPDTIVI